MRKESWFTTVRKSYYLGCLTQKVPLTSFTYTFDFDDEFGYGTGIMYFPCHFDVYAAALLTVFSNVSNTCWLCYFATRKGELVDQITIWSWGLLTLFLVDTHTQARFYFVYYICVIWGLAEFWLGLRTKEGILCIYHRGAGGTVSWGWMAWLGITGTGGRSSCS